MFFLLYKHTDNVVFVEFPKISDHFPKIYEDSPKLFRRPDECSRTFSENFRKFPKMSDDFRRLPKTFEGDPKMFRWYTNEFKYNLRDKRDITEIIDIFTCEDIVSFLSICYHPLYHWLLYNNMYFCSCWCNPYVSENVEHFAAQFSHVQWSVRSKSVNVQLCTDRQRRYDWLTANKRMWPVRWADVCGEERVTSLRTSVWEASDC